MHQRNILDINASGGRIFDEKDLTTDTSLGRSASEWKTTVSGSLPMFNIHSLGSLESDVNRHIREPEFIETDFTSPLTEVERPLSLKANEVLKSDIHSSVNKRPYSASQISEHISLGKSLTFLNMPMSLYNSTHQESEKARVLYGTGSSKTHGMEVRCMETTPILIKTSTFNNPFNNSEIKVTFSQRSSLPQSTSMVQNHSQKLISLLPKQSQSNVTQPNVVVYSGVSNYKPNFKMILPKRKAESVAFVPKVAQSAHIPLSYFPMSSASQESSSFSNLFHNSPLNLSKSSERGRTSAKMEVSHPRREAESNCEHSIPLNLISKKKESYVPTDLCLQSSLPRKYKSSSLSSPDKMYKDMVTSPFHLIHTNNQENVCSVSRHLEVSDPPLMPFPKMDLVTKCKELPQSSGEENVSILKEEDTSWSSVDLQSKTSSLSLPVNLSGALEASVKEEVASCNSLQDDGPLLQEYDDNKFIWDDYLEHCGANAAPSASFRHVESSLQNGLTKGMIVEVANKDPVGTFWVASIIMSCGQLLMLRPACCQNGASLDFWCDMSTCELHPAGWCANHQKQICPPKYLADKVDSNWELSLKELMALATTPPPNMLDQKTGSLLFDQIQIEMIYEVQHELDPDKLWYARVVENIGGRLSLRYEGDQDVFRLFYTSYRLHPLGFSLECNKELVPPSEIRMGRSTSEWKDLASKCEQEALTNSPTIEVFKDQETLDEHNAQEGWRMELLDSNKYTFRVAHISKIINEYYFIVEPDDFSQPGEESPLKFCCHKNSSIIFPIGWHREHNLQLLPVPGIKYINK